MNILVLNSGSSSIRFQIIETDVEQIANNTDRRLARGHLERIGGEAVITLHTTGREPERSTAQLRDVRAAVEFIVRWACSEASGIDEVQSVADVHAVGHRVVHGGERFTHSVLITDDVLRGIEDCIDLAPLHNPANIKGIVAAREVFGTGLPQAAVFDTAFHQSLPEPSCTRCLISSIAATAYAATASTARRIATSLTDTDNCWGLSAKRPTSSRFT
jgi:acetate kinase